MEQGGVTDTGVKFDVYEGMFVHVSFDRADVEMEHFQRHFLDCLQEVLDSGEPFTLLVDSTQLSGVPLSVGFDVVKFMRANQAKFRASCRASAIVISHPFIKGLLEWVFTLSPPVSPNVIVDTAADGAAFLEGYNNKTS